jgi:hypothetical protein
MTQKEQKQSFRRLQMPMKYYKTQKRDRFMINMEKKGLRDKRLGSNQEVVVVADSRSHMKIFLHSSLVVVKEVVAVAKQVDSNNILNSILDKVDNNINSSNNNNLKRIYLKIQMLSNLISSKSSSFTEEKKFG